MSTLAIDIGGTKFSVAVFEGKRMVERESHSTDRAGGRDWMLAKIADGHPQLGRPASLRLLWHRLWRPRGFRPPARRSLDACPRME